MDHRAWAIRSVVLAVFVVVAPPGWAQPGGGFASPPDTVIKKLREDQDVFGWLRVTTDSTRLEIKARLIDEQGLSGFKFRRSVPFPPESIPWSSISRIDAGGSRLHKAGIGAVAGALVLGAVGGAAAATTEEDESWDQVWAALSGGLVGGLIGIGVGGVVGAAFPPWHKVYEAQVPETKGDGGPPPETSVPTADAFPPHEVWLGAGDAVSFEENVFNVPNDFESSPQIVGTFGYLYNFNPRFAIGLHMYGGFETIEGLLVGSSGGSQSIHYELNTANLGVRGRYTLARARFVPYVFAGASWAFGSIADEALGELSFNGISVCAGAGVGVMLGHQFMLSAEGLGSFGTASWEGYPFVDSDSDEFNPSLAGGTLNISYAWGR